MINRDQCGCLQNEAGDIRCHNCGEYVNRKCWRCGLLRGFGNCPLQRIREASQSKSLSEPIKAAVTRYLSEYNQTHNQPLIPSRAAVSISEALTKAVMKVLDGGQDE